MGVGIRNTAKAAGIVRTALDALLSGKWMPRPSTEQNLARAIGVARDRLRLACLESCRRAGNLEATKQRPHGEREDLRELLTELGVVLRDYAKASSLSRTTLYALMDGRWMPAPDRRVALAEAAGVGVERLRRACEESCRRAGNTAAIEDAG